jgi:hypothetical protein
MGPSVHYVISTYRAGVRFWPDSGLVDAGCRVADWRKVLQIARGVDCYHIYRSWSKEFDGAVFGGVAKHQRFTSKVLVPVPNPVPNLGVRGEWKGCEFQESQ